MNSVMYLSLFITEKCNLRCPYCFAAGMEKRDIDPQTAFRAIDFLFLHAGDERSVHISFWGGEPLLRFDLIKRLVSYAESKAEKAEKKIIFSIPTNTTLLTMEILNYVKRHNIGLSLSIDGTDKSQRFRKTLSGRSSYGQVVRNLKLLEQAGDIGRVSVRKTVTPENVSNLSRDLEFFLQLGFRSIAFSPVMESPWTEKAYGIFQSEQLKCADMWISSLKEGKPFFVQSWTDILLLRQFLNKKKTYDFHTFFCGAGSTMIAVDIDGDIFPCHRFVFYDKEKRKEKLGSIKNGFTEKERRLRYTDINLPQKNKNYGQCERCTLFHICNLLCPATNYSLTGDIYNLRPRICRFFTITENVLGVIEQKTGNIPDYREFNHRLMRSVYQYSYLSRFNRLFWQRVMSEDVEVITEKTSLILQRLRGDMEK
jgi:uncharacterized protein